MSSSIDHLLRAPLDKNLFDTLYTRPSPRLAMVVGNGFTLGYINHCGLAASVDTAVNRLLPPLAAVEYLPGPSDVTPQQPLWTSGAACLFHALLATWRPNESFFDLCARLATLGPLNRGTRDGNLTVELSGPAYELRVYLWYLFKYYDIALFRGFSDRRANFWPWLTLFATFFRLFRPVFVSFNYDCVLENVLTAAFKTGVAVPNWTAHSVLSRQSSWPIVLKPHGSIAFDSSPGFSNGGNWRSGMSLESCRAIPYDQDVPTKYPPTSCPMLPDLVPPGHSDHHLCDPNSTIRHAVTSWMERADAVVICGLRGDGPDEQEMNRYFRSLPAARIAVYVGTDENCVVSRLLKNALGSRYRFVHATADGYWFNSVADSLGREFYGAELKVG